MITAQEIIDKYIDGKLSQGLSWILDNLNKDPEVMTGSCIEKERLRKFLQTISDDIEEFLQAGCIDERDNQDDADIFGDEDIIVSPESEQDDPNDFLDNDGGDPFNFGGDDEDDGQGW